MSRLDRLWLLMPPSTFATALFAMQFTMGSAFAEAADTALAEYTTIRATGPQLPQPVVKFVAEELPPTRLGRNQYPEAGAFTPEQIVKVLCGSVRNDYMGLLMARFHLNPTDLQKPIGTRVYDIDWPACLFVKNQPSNAIYTVHTGDTLSALRQRFTGVTGNVATNARFFGIPTAQAATGKLSPGQQLQVPYTTSALTVHAPTFQGSVLKLQQLAADIVPSGNSGDLLQVATPASGRIVTFMGGNGTEPVDPPECAGAIGPPFDLARLHAAYAFARTRATALNAHIGAVSVFVVDNGFFGVRPNTSSGITSGKHFPQQYFDTYVWGGTAGLIGPITPEQSGDISPLNVLNQFTSADSVSGHGTHVTGLILGGPAWSPYQPEAFALGGVPLVRIAEMNIGRGSENLVPDAHTLLSRTFSLSTTSYVVNMSISYDGSTPGIAQSLAFMNEATAGASPHLFVVAAGNDSLGNTLDKYPAAFGASASVVTVAAVGPDGTLTGFTNMGSTVDVAAPGCHISSWIDDSDAVVPLTGTSQAAPTVTFEAVLMRSLTGASPSQIKARIIASGDLLSDKDQSRLATPIAVNLEKALYLFDDYVRYSDNYGEHEILGTVLRLDGMSCTSPSGPVPGDFVRAFKTRAATKYLFYAPTSAPMTICPAQVDISKGRLVFAPKFKIDRPNYPRTTDASLELSLKNVIEFVRAGPL